MAITVLPQQYNPWAEAGAQLGSGISGGVSTGLQMLVERKLNQMQKTPGLQALGIPNAEALSTLDPKILEMVVKQKLQEPSQEAFAQALGQMFGQEPQIAQEEIQPREEFFPSDKKEQIINYLNSPKAQKEYTPAQIKQALDYLQKPTAKATQEIAKPTIKPKLTEKQALKLAELNLKKEENLEKKKIAAFKHTKKTAEAIAQKTKTANEMLESIERLEELEQEGLPSAGYFEFLKNAGLDIASLAGAPAEEYNKIAANFIRGAKDVYGGRVSNQEMEQFLKTVPSLANSPEGRKRINANLRRIANLQKEEGKIYRQILKENKGIPPFDLDAQIEERMEKRREHYAKQFKQDLKKEVPEGESALKTTLLSIAGKAVGNIPKAIKGAGLGALTGGAIGARGGPIGALGGGVLGGLAGLAGINPSLREFL